METGFAHRHAQLFAHVMITGGRVEPAVGGTEQVEPARPSALEGDVRRPEMENEMSRDFKEDVLSGVVDPIAVSSLGLKGRSKVYVTSTHCGVVIERESRFLRKDAESFVSALEAARLSSGRMLSGMILIRRAPVCSQAKRWLEDQDIEVSIL